MVLLLNLVGAIDIYAGDSYSFTLNEQYSYYEITGNQTEIDLDIQQNGTNITINFGKYMDDTFTITFYNEKDEIVEQEETTSSSSKGVCWRGWTTSMWTTCLNGEQERIVTKDWKTCHLQKQDKPIEIQDCEIKDDKEIINIEINHKDNWFISLIKWVWDKIIFWK